MEYIHIRTYAHRHTYLHSYTRAYMHTCIHTYMHTYIHTCIHTYRQHTYIHTYIHTYRHTYIQTYISICISLKGGLNFQRHQVGPPRMFKRIPVGYQHKSVVNKSVVKDTAPGLDALKATPCHWTARSGSIYVLELLEKAWGLPRKLQGT